MFRSVTKTYHNRCKSSYDFPRSSLALHSRPTKVFSSRFASTKASRPCARETVDVDASAREDTAATAAEVEVEVVDVSSAMRANPETTRALVARMLVERCARVLFDVGGRETLDRATRGRV